LTQILERAETTQACQRDVVAAAIDEDRLARNIWVRQDSLKISHDGLEFELAREGAA
jgi:hypothetical protein